MTSASATRSPTDAAVPVAAKVRRPMERLVRIAAFRDPGAHGATAPIPPAVASAPVRGAKPSRRMPAPGV
jgi:hypothetical protein